MKTKLETLQAKLIEVEESINSAPYAIRSAYCNHKAVSELLNDKKSQLITEILSHNNPRPLDGNSMAHGARLAMGQITSDFCKYSSFAALIESTPEFIQAQKSLFPLVAQHAQLLTDISEEQTKIGRINAEKLEKMEAEKAAAFAAIESKFAIA